MKVGLPARKTDRHYTYGDYKTWPEDERWELIDGVAWCMSPAPSLNHQALALELGRRIGNYLQRRPCRVFAAPVDVFFPADSTGSQDDVDTVVQPDVIVVCDPSRLRSNGVWGAPDWVVEIISPWTQKKDLAEKFDLYQRSRVKEYWTVDPGNRSVVVYVLEQGPDGNQRYGDGRVFAEPAQVQSMVIEGLVIDFVEVLAWMLA